MNATARLIAMCCVAAFPALSSAALATEVPPEVSAASLLRGNEKGPNYTVLSPVQSDGLMRIFRVETPFGTYRVQGDAQLKTRIRELAAVRRLETMKASDTFVKSLGQAAAAPLKYGADLITDPKETLTRSVSGIANMFDRIGAGVRNQGASRDNVATSLLGIDTARRHLAVELGVDPYSDFPPLQKQLEDVATAAGLGGLSIQALTMAIPGGAGVAVSSVASANTFADTLKQKTSAQIIDQVSATLKRLGVPERHGRGFRAQPLLFPGGPAGHLNGPPAAQRQAEQHLHRQGRGCEVRRRGRVPDAACRRHCPQQRNSGRHPQLRRRRRLSAQPDRERPPRRGVSAR